MKFFHRIRQLGCVTVALIMTAVNCPAEADIQVEDRGLDLTEEISIHYPAVTIAEDAELEARINDQIQADNGIKEYLARAAQLISGGSLKTEWTGGIVGEDLLICMVSAEGALETTRPTHVRTGSNIDLRDGHEITAGELFTLQNSEITPMPETFVIEPAGLRLLYPINQLSTLSDRAGDIRIGWYRLREVLDLSEGSILSRLGAEEMIELSPESAEKLRNFTAEGSLPGIPAAYSCDISSNCCVPLSSSSSGVR